MLNLGNKFKEFKKAVGMIFVCALLALAVGLSGCTGAEPADPVPEDVPAPAMGKTEFRSLRNNPLEIIETQEESTSGNTRTTYFCNTIAGLSDKAVEEKVNGRIMEVVEQQKTADIPSYRGIKTKVTSDYVLTDRQITQTVQGSFNNILSINVYMSMSYVHKDDLWQKEAQGYYDNVVYVAETIPLTFDLNTGDEVQLKDVFHDDVDYMNVLNQWMDRHLALSSAVEEGWYPSSYELDLKLVGPFKGLPEDQGFYLTPYGLALVFGPDDTQFTSPYGFYTSTVTISWRELSDITALAYRFMDEETELYTSSEHPVYSLLNMTEETVAGTAEHYMEDNISFNMALRYQDGLPENIVEKILELGAFDETIVQELKDSLTSESSGYYDVSVYANCVGDYISLNFAESVYGWNENGEPCYDHYRNEYYSYHADTGEPLELAELFYERWNPEEIITNGMYRNQRKLSDLYDEVPKEDYVIRDEVHQLYACFTSFSVDTTGLNLLGSWVDEETGETRTQWTSVPYEDIGCQYMTIFD